MRFISSLVVQPTFRRFNRRNIQGNWSVMVRLYLFVFVALFFLPIRGEGRQLLKLDETKVTCRSFFYNTQVNNNQGWTVPNNCVNFVGNYMEGLQYSSDSQGVLDDAESFLQTVSLMGNGKDIVVFDVDETALSNLPYYRNHAYGGETYNNTAFNIWVNQGTAPAIPATLKLYNFLKGIQIGVVLITGRAEEQRAVTTENLIAVGYSNWTELILKSPEDSGTTALQYKSKKRTELAAKGYHIYSSVGDQWSDISGPFVGNRTFKVPNPMYFIA